MELEKLSGMAEPGSLFEIERKQPWKEPAASHMPSRKAWTAEFLWSCVGEEPCILGIFLPMFD